MMKNPSRPLVPLLAGLLLLFLGSAVASASGLDSAGTVANSGGQGGSSARGAPVGGQGQQNLMQGPGGSVNGDPVDGRATVDGKRCYLHDVAQDENERLHTLGSGGGETGQVTLRLFSDSQPTGCLETQTVGGVQGVGGAFVASRNYKIVGLVLVGDEWHERPSDPASWLGQSAEVVERPQASSADPNPREVEFVRYKFTATANTTDVPRAARIRWENVPVNVPGYPGIILHEVMVVQSTATPAATPCGVVGLDHRDSGPTYVFDDVTSRFEVHLSFWGECAAADLAPDLMEISSGQSAATWATSSTPSITRAWTTSSADRGRASVRIGAAAEHDRPLDRTALARWWVPYQSAGRGWQGHSFTQKGKPAPPGQTQLACVDPRRSPGGLIPCPREIAPGEQVKMRLLYDGTLSGTVRRTRSGLVEEKTHHLGSAHEQSIRAGAPYGPGWWWVSLADGSAGTLDGYSRELWWTAPHRTGLHTVTLAGALIDTFQDNDPLQLIPVEAAHRGSVTFHVTQRQRPEVLPTLSIASALTVAEAATAALTVTLSETSARSVAFDYGTADGTATAGQDYTSASGRVIIAAGNTTATIRVTTTADTDTEADEALQVTISRPDGATIAVGAATITITDDDAATLTPSGDSTATVAADSGGTGGKSARADGAQPAEISKRDQKQQTLVNGLNSHTTRATVGTNTCLINDVAERESRERRLDAAAADTGKITVRLFSSQANVPNPPDDAANQCPATQTVDGTEVPGAGLIAARNYTIKEQIFMNQEWTDTDTDSTWLTQKSETFIDGGTSSLNKVEYDFQATANTGENERRAKLVWANIPARPTGYPYLQLRSVTIIQPTSAAAACRVVGVIDDDATPSYGYDDVTTRYSVGVAFRGECATDSSQLVPELRALRFIGGQNRWAITDRAATSWATAETATIETPWSAMTPNTNATARVKIGFRTVNTAIVPRAFTARWRISQNSFGGHRLEQDGNPPPDGTTQVVCINPGVAQPFGAATNVASHQINCPTEVAPGEQVKMQMLYKDPLTGTVDGINWSLRAANEQDIGTGQSGGGRWWVNDLTSGGVLTGYSRELWWTAPQLPRGQTSGTVTVTLVAAHSGTSGSRPDIPPTAANRGTQTFILRNNTRPEVRIGCVPTNPAPRGGCSTNLVAGQSYDSFVDFYAVIEDANGVSTGNADSDDDTHRVTWSSTDGFGTTNHSAAYGGVSRSHLSWSPPDDGAGQTFTITATVYDADKHVVEATRIVRIVEALPAAPEPEVLPTLSIGSAVTVAEGARAELTVTLSAVAAADVTFTYSTRNGTAREGRDFYGGDLPKTATIAAGATTTTVGVLTQDDVIDESDETFSIVLGQPRGATIAAGTGTVTITDDDTQPSLSLASAVTVAEGSAASLTVTLSEASARPVAFDYWTSDGTATSGRDYTSASGRVVIAAGVTTATISVTTTDDTETEGDETIKVTISRPDGATIASAVSAATITITDDDAATLTLSLDSTATVAEGSAASLTVTLSAASTAAVTFHYGTADGTATAGEDYTAATGQEGSIASGSTTTTVSVSTLDDTLDEADETFTVALSRPAGATIASGTGTVTITDNDEPPPPLPTLSVGNATVTEARTAAVTVTLSAASATAISFDYATSNGTATAGADYRAASGRLTIAAGATTGTINVVTTHDTTDELDETLTVSISNPQGADIAAATGTVTITDDDEPVEAARSVISIHDASGVEGDTVTFTVTRESPFHTTFSFTWFTETGTADGSDFTQYVSSQEVTFPTGARTRSIAVATTEDSLEERDETFTVRISLPTGGPAILGDASGLGTIIDDDEVAPVASQNDCSTADLTQTSFSAGDLYCGQFHSNPSGNAAPTNYTNPTRYSEPEEGHKPTVQEGYRLVAGVNRICAYKGKCARSWQITEGLETNGDQDYWEWVTVHAAER